MDFLELQRDSRVTTGNSGCLLCWPREVQSSIRVGPINNENKETDYASFSLGHREGIFMYIHLRTHRGELDSRGEVDAFNSSRDYSVSFIEDALWY